MATEIRLRPERPTHTLTPVLAHEISPVTPADENHLLAGAGRRVILLTVFPKTRNAEAAEIARARHAQKICEAEHGTAHQVFDREVN